MNININFNTIIYISAALEEYYFPVRATSTLLHVYIQRHLNYNGHVLKVAPIYSSLLGCWSVL